MAILAITHVLKAESEYHDALARMDALLGKKKLTAREKDSLDLLLVLLADYEKRKGDSARSRPCEVLRFLMEQNGLKQVELVAFLGITKGHLSNLLAGKRAFSDEVAGKLGVRFNLPASLFL